MKTYEPEAPRTNAKADGAAGFFETSVGSRLDGVSRAGSTGGLTSGRVYSSLILDSG